MFDQHVAKNSFESIVPDLATKWVTSADGKQVVFTLRQGVKWHDGKPFTAKDVACTFELLLVEGKLRRNPRGALFSNVEKVTADSDFAATFHLKERQPSLLALLATRATRRSIPATSRRPTCAASRSAPGRSSSSSSR